MAKKNLKKKRQKFQKAAQKKKKSNKMAAIVIGSIVALAAVVVVVIALTSSGSGGKTITNNSSGQSTEVQMTSVEATVENGKIAVSLDDVKKNKLVSFTYEGGTEPVPLLAYALDNGEIVTAVSVCEPCKSETFHIKDGVLVCNACGTTWTLGDHKGIDGGCKEYPPDILEKVTIEGDKILIDETEVKEWKPRV